LHSASGECSSTRYPSGTARAAREAFSQRRRAGCARTFRVRQSRGPCMRRAGWISAHAHRPIHTRHVSPLHFPPSPPQRRPANPRWQRAPVACSSSPVPRMRGRVERALATGAQASPWRRRRPGGRSAALARVCVVHEVVVGTRGGAGWMEPDPEHGPYRHAH
jgi:hypothetical protein